MKAPRWGLLQHLYNLRPMPSVVVLGSWLDRNQDDDGPEHDADLPMWRNLKERNVWMGSSGSLWLWVLKLFLPKEEPAQWASGWCRCRHDTGSRLSEQWTQYEFSSFLLTKYSQNVTHSINSKEPLTGFTVSFMWNGTVISNWFTPLGLLNSSSRKSNRTKPT